VGAPIELNRIEIADHHDIGAYARTFKRRGRIHIRSFLKEDSARAIYDCLMQRLTYDAIYASKDKHRSDHLTEAELANLKPEIRDRFLRAIDHNAKLSFQYLHLSHRLSYHGEVPEDQPPDVKPVTEFMTGEPFLDFVRKVTGDRTIVRADVQATRYLPGHFIGPHDDNMPDDPRRAAYVFNLTPKWEPSWGGILMFPTSDGHIDEGYVPAFNALNIFRIPQRHLVSQIAPHASEDRVSLSGWFKSK
jgi:SM-20-related protein